MRRSVMRSKSKIYNNGRHSSVARRLHVNFGISNQDRALWRGFEFAQNRAHTFWIGLLGLKAVAAIDGAEFLR